MIVNTKDTINTNLDKKERQKQYREKEGNKEKARIYMKVYMQKKRAKELTERLEQERLNPTPKTIFKKSISHLKNILKIDRNEYYKKYRQLERDHKIKMNLDTKRNTQ
tara:strand:- start:31 stop:354 length:324 start_codon:yes stop_codon:yes gene_type:complete